MANIAIDIRCLTQQYKTGVGEYTTELLNSFFEMDSHNHYYLFYNSWKDVSSAVCVWKQKNVHYVVTQWPNKLLNMLLWIGIIKLDTFIAQRIIQEPRSNAIAKEGTYSTSQEPQNINQPKSKQKNIHLDYFFSPNITFVSLSKKVHFILTVHDLSFKYFKSCFSWKRKLWHVAVRPKKQILRANTIIVPSIQTRSDMMREFNIPFEKFVVAHPRLSYIFRLKNICQDVEQTVIQKYNLPKKFILFLGTLEPRKNILGLLHAYSDSKIYKKNIELVIAGVRGWRYDDIISAIDHIHGVHYIGYVQNEDKPILYRLSSAFVYPSLYEGYGIPVAEALACGVPIITSNRSSLPEVVGYDKALLVDPLNIHDMTQSINYLLKTYGSIEK